jgi:hypothetical protein
VEVKKRARGRGDVQFMCENCPVEECSVCVRNWTKPCVVADSSALGKLGLASWENPAGCLEFR